MLYTAFRKIRHGRALAAKGGQITVDGDRITYPSIQKGTVEEDSFTISDIASMHYNEEDGILTVSLNSGKIIKFDVEFFDDLAHLKEFVELIQK